MAATMKSSPSGTFTETELYYGSLGKHRGTGGAGGGGTGGHFNLDFFSKSPTTTTTTTAANERFYVPREQQPMQYSTTTSGGGLGGGYYYPSTSRFQIYGNSHERRRLVAELRAEALRTSPGARRLGANSSPSTARYPVQSITNGYASSPDTRYRHHDEASFSSVRSSRSSPRRAPGDDQDGSVLNVSVESVAQQELEELIRSTESLSKIGSELLSFAQEYAKAPTPAVSTGATAGPAKGAIPTSTASPNKSVSSKPPSAEAGTSGAAAPAMEPAASSTSTKPVVSESAQPPPPSVEMPPAHAEASAIEEERARRKREILERKKREQELAFAAAAATVMVAPSETTTASPARAASEAQPEPASKPVHSAPTSSSSTAQQTNTTSTNDDDAMSARARRYSNLAHRAMNVRQESDPATSIVLFGQFLLDPSKAKSPSNVSSSSSTSPNNRPPPVVGHRSSSVDRRRANSFDDAKTLEVPKVSSTPVNRKSFSKSFRQVSSPTSFRDAASNHANNANGNHHADPAADTGLQVRELEGFLFKTSGPKKRRFLGTMKTTVKWERRYFILSGRLLIYTPNENSRDVKRMMDLNLIDVVTDPKVIKDFNKNILKTPHCIAIWDPMEPGKMLTLCAESHAEILEWYKAIVGNIALLASHRKPQTSLPPPDATVVPPEVIKRKQLMEAHRKSLPEPPEPLEIWFYPHYRLPPSYYDLLGVKPNATSKEIKVAYYKLAKDAHPDRNPDVSHEQFAAISHAYETLIDETKRADHDLAEAVAERLRRGVDLVQWITLWDDDDIAREPRLRVPHTVAPKPMTIFCDGDLKCLYWQDAGKEGEPLPPLRPRKDRCIEMRFVQQVLFARDIPGNPHLFGKRCSYEEETRFAILGDRLFTGILIYEMPSPKECSDMVRGLRIARCKASMLFQQRLAENVAAGIL